jgi:hypothetical protein
MRRARAAGLIGEFAGEKAKPGRVWPHMLRHSVGTLEDTAALVLGQRR